MEQVIKIIPDNDSNGMVGKLRSITKNLERFNNSTESEFIYIGENLQGFFIRAKELHATGESAARLMSGEGIKGSIEMLSKLVERMKENFKISEEKQSRNMGAIQSIVKGIGSLHYTLEEFYKIVLSMRILGIATRIESTNLTSGRRNFRIFAHRIIQQSVKIESKVNDFESELYKHSNRITEIIAHLIDLENEQNVQGYQVIKNIRNSLDTLTNKQNESSLIADSISSICEVIENNIGEIVSSVQFHDITRQQIEHVIEGLNGITDNTEPEYLRETCWLQTIQLRNAKDEFINAVNNITDFLHNIANNVSSISDKTLDLIGSTQGGDSDFISGFVKDVSVVTTALSKYQEMSDELSKAVSSVANILGIMSTFLKEVDVIAYSIKYIALNSAVKAAKIGEEGAAMEVVSNNIQSLSYQAFETTQNVSDRLKKLILEVETIKERTAIKSVGSDEGDENISNELNTLLTSIGEMNDRTIEMLTNIDNTGLNLAKDIDMVADGISIHKAANQEISAVINGLEDVAGKMPESKYRESHRDNIELLDVQANRYTMEMERKIYQNWKSKPTDDASVIDSENSVKNTSNDNDELGSNVELF